MNQIYSSLCEFSPDETRRLLAGIVYRTLRLDQHSATEILSFIREDIVMSPEYDEDLIELIMEHS